MSENVKCGSCFYFRCRMAGGFNGTTHCNNIAQKIEDTGFKYGYYDIEPTKQACKRYRNEKQEAQRRYKKQKKTKNNKIYKNKS